MQIVLLPLNLLNTNLTKWSNTHKQFVGELPTNCLSVFDYFVGFALKGLTAKWIRKCISADYPWMLCRNMVLHGRTYITIVGFIRN